MEKLFQKNPDLVVTLAFDYLVSDFADKKKEVRELITSKEWFSPEAILKLSKKLKDDAHGGWGRAKRSAIAVWYLNRPISVVKRQIEECPKVGSWGHADVIRFLHIIDIAMSSKNNEERINYLRSVIGVDTSDQPKKEKSNQVRKKGFWSFLFG